MINKEIETKLLDQGVRALTVQTMRDAFQSWGSFTENVTAAEIRLLVRHITVGGTGHDRVERKPPKVAAVDATRPAEGYSSWYGLKVQELEDQGVPAPVLREEQASRAKTRIRDLCDEVGAVGARGGQKHVLVVRGKHVKGEKRTIKGRDGKPRPAYPGKPLIALVDIWWLSQALGIEVDDLVAYAYAQRDAALVG